MSIQARGETGRLRAGVAIVLLATSALAGCRAKAKGVDVDPVALIPADADFAVSIQLAPLRASAAAPTVHAMLSQDGEYKDLVESFPACDIDLDNVVITAAMKLGESGADTMMLVARGPGLGDQDKLQCIEKEYARSSGDGAGRLVFGTKGDVLVAPIEDGYEIILNKDAFAVVDTAWHAPLMDLIASKGQSDAEQSLRAPMARVDKGSHAWLALRLTDAMKADLFGVPHVDAMSDVAVSADVSTGLKARIGLRFADGDSAASFRQLVTTEFAAIKPDLVEQGVPAAALDKVELGGEGDLATISVEFDPDQLTTVIMALGVSAMAGE